MIQFKQKGDFSDTMNFLKRIQNGIDIKRLERFGEEGVKALKEATPVRTGKTADSWYYEIRQERGSVIISFNNTNRNNGVPVALVLEYGHATPNGGWIEGRNFIHPAIQPVFDRILNDAWEEVTKK